MIETCKSCMIAQDDASAPFIYKDDLWTINLLLGPPPPKILLGWSVLQPRRHVKSINELNAEELQSFGIILARCESAMKDVLGVERMYTCLFAEDTSFHLHFHLIPRRSTLPTDYIGPAVFKIKSPEFELADPDYVDAVLTQLSATLMY